MRSSSAQIPALPASEHAQPIQPPAVRDHTQLIQPPAVREAAYLIQAFPAHLAPAAHGLAQLIPRDPLPAPREFAHLDPVPPPPEITQLDNELHRLTRGAGRLRLRIGQALHRLGEGIHELGFSTLGAYALERCNRGARWAAETRTLARRLRSLPRLTEALESGSIGWSMAELLARHATPQTEAALLQVARGKTVQAMRIALNPQDSPDPPDDDDLTRTLSLTLPVEEAWALAAGSLKDEAGSEPVQISGSPKDERPTEW